jgi:hypothetical protein
MNTALEYSTRVVQEGVRRCKKNTLNDLVHLTPLRIPLMNPPQVIGSCANQQEDYFHISPYAHRHLLGLQGWRISCIYHLL